MTKPYQAPASPGGICERDLVRLRSLEQECPRVELAWDWRMPGRYWLIEGQVAGAVVLRAQGRALGTCLNSFRSAYGRAIEAGLILPKGANPK